MQPDPAAATVVLLARLLQQGEAIANASGTPVPSPPLPFDPATFDPTPSRVSTRVNVLWAMSLTLSLICALMATLVQQWARQYLRRTLRRVVPKKRARLRAHLYKAVQIFGMETTVSALPTLLHVSVALFLAGFIEYQLMVSRTVAHAVLAIAVAAGTIYLTFTILPIARHDCPYWTPLSIPVIIVLKVFKRLVTAVPKALDLLIRPVLSCMKPWLGRCIWRTMVYVPHKFLSRFDGFIPLPRRLWDDDLTDKSSLDAEALRWTLDSLDDDMDFERFIDGIPDFMKDNAESADNTFTELYSSHLEKRQFLDRIRALAETCTESSGLSEPVRKRRLVSCTKALLCLPPTLLKDSYRTDIQTYLLDTPLAHADLASACKALRFQMADPRGNVAVAARQVLIVLWNNLAASDTTDWRYLLKDVLRMPPPLADRIAALAEQRVYSRLTYAMAVGASFLQDITSPDSFNPSLIDKHFHTVAQRLKQLHDDSTLQNLSDAARTLALDALAEVVAYFEEHHAIHIDGDTVPSLQTQGWCMMMITLRTLRSRLQDAGPGRPASSQPSEALYSPEELRCSNAKELCRWNIISLSRNNMAQWRWGQDEARMWRDGWYDASSRSVRISVNSL